MESNCKKLKLDDVDGAAFRKAFNIWCSKEHCCTEIELDEIRELASVADQFQMTEVILALDETVVQHLEMRMCGEVLCWSGERGLKQAETAARKLATERFEDLTNTDGFMRMGEEVLGRLLDDDELAARNEEAVWEAVAGWRRAEEGPARGRGLV